MKVRLGFVSNSSACSFCVYGFVFSREERPLVEEILKRAKAIGLDAFEMQDQNCQYIVGVGNYDSDFDHDEDEDWQNYEADPPSQEEVDKFTELAKELAPDKELDYHADTYFNG